MRDTAAEAFLNHYKSASMETLEARLRDLKHAESAYESWVQIWTGFVAVVALIGAVLLSQNQQLTELTKNIEMLAAISPEQTVELQKLANSNQIRIATYINLFAPVVVAALCIFMAIRALGLRSDAAWKISVIERHLARIDSHPQPIVVRVHHKRRWGWGLIRISGTVEGREEPSTNPSP